MSADLVIRNARLVDEDGESEGHLAVNDGRIAGLVDDPVGRKVIDAAGRYVMPGGVDTHVHMGQLSSLGEATADDFWTGSRSAAFGGTTTVVPFAAQHQTDSISDVWRDSLQRGMNEMAVDYGMHLIVTGWDNESRTQLETAAAEGLSCVKLYLTYDRLKLDGTSARQVMEAAAELSLRVMVHAEDDAIVTRGRQGMLAAGRLEATSHAHSHSAEAEIAGVEQAIRLATTAGAALHLVHISTATAVALAAEARNVGLDVVVETCPHYLLLTDDRLDAQITTAAPFMCSPPLRSGDEVQALTESLRDRQIDLVNSDHSPYTMDQKLPAGPATPFHEVANGLPGVELRLPLIYTVATNLGLSKRDVVRLVSANPARAAGLYPRKGSLHPGADADLVIWDTRPRIIRWDDLHDNVGYSPYEDMEVSAWPHTVILRGDVIVGPDRDAVTPGGGRFQPRIGST